MDYADFIAENETSVIPSEVEESCCTTLRFRRGVSRFRIAPLGMTITAPPSLLLEHLHRVPRFVGRSVFVFERASQVHLGQ
jgi:hypothetical protein